MIKIKRVGLIDVACVALVRDCYMQAKPMQHKWFVFVRRLLLVVLLVTVAGGAIVWVIAVRPRHFGALRLLFSRPVELSPVETAKVHEWLREHAISLETVEAGAGFDDMQRLKGVIGEARIVSLGEAAHLNRSFAQAKHRMVEFLVSEMDFRVLAFEGPFAGALELNDYVLGGEGDPRRALGALVFPAWTTEAVLEMVMWLREYNATPERKVTFYGFDNKPATGSARAVYDYLKKTQGPDDYDDLLSTLMNGWTARQVTSGPKENLAAATGETEGLISYLERAGDGSEKGTPAYREWQMVLQHARVVLQNLKFHGTSSISKASNLRDEHMAENVRWVVDYEGGARTILWAANGHISATPFSGCMGAHLRRVYGDDMVVIGLLRNRKSSGALGEEVLGEGSHEMPSSKAGTLEAVFTRAGLERAVVDFRSLPKGIAGRYLNSPFQSSQGVKTIYPLAYDAVLFIEATSNARSICLGSLGTTETLDTPSNLGFEEVVDGLIRGWRIQAGQAQLEYVTTGSNERPYEGKMCGVIKRAPGRRFGESSGNLMQAIKADDFRGKKMRLGAAVRVSEGAGYLWLSIDVRKGPGVFVQQEIASDTWQEYHLSAGVPHGALKITYGLAYVGEGAACIDKVSVEAIN